MIRVEVCVEDVAGASAARDAGADRVELCSALVIGGVTPSAAAIELVARVGIDVVVLVRPRAGDFVYGSAESDTVTGDIEFAKRIGAHGVAIGALTRDGRIDTPRMRDWIDAARPLAVTCHRAFDMTRDPREALDALIELGVDRVLTSGQAPTAPRGAELIRELVVRAAGRIAIMPGGGIGEADVRPLVERTGVTDVHFSASGVVASAMEFRRESCSMGTVPMPGEYELRVTDAARLARYLAALP